jgi:hypothetical protein
MNGFQRLPLNSPVKAWRVVWDHSATCRVTVPWDWKQVSGFGLATDPLSHSMVAVHADKQHGWAELRRHIRLLPRPVRVLEDETDRYAYQFGAQGLHYFATRRFNRFNCIAQVDVWESAPSHRLHALANRITTSLNGFR